jgi:Na+-driven multidrug efflux pump
MAPLLSLTVVTEFPLAMSESVATCIHMGNALGAGAPRRARSVAGVTVGTATCVATSVVLCLSIFAARFRVPLVRCVPTVLYAP